MEEKKSLITGYIKEMTHRELVEALYKYKEIPEVAEDLYEKAKEFFENDKLKPNINKKIHEILKILEREKEPFFSVFTKLQELIDSGGADGALRLNHEIVTWSNIMIEQYDQDGDLADEFAEELEIFEKALEASSLSIGEKNKWIEDTLALDEYSLMTYLDDLREEQ